MESISKRENQIIYEINNREMILFNVRDICRFLSISRNNANRILQRMKRKDLLTTVEKGKYILTDSLKELDIYELASNLYQPSYLAFWSALHVHSMTDQVPRTIFLATTQRKRDLELQGQRLEYITIKNKLYFGYEILNRIIVSDREKTIIDCLRHPEYSGGIEHIFKSIPDDLDMDKLLEYCVKTGSSSVASRLGFLLEKKGYNFHEDLFISLITTYSRLDPAEKNKNSDSKWKLYINRDYR